MYPRLSKGNAVLLALWAIAKGKRIFAFPPIEFIRVVLYVHYGLYLSQMSVSRFHGRLTEKGLIAKWSRPLKIHGDHVADEMMCRFEKEALTLINEDLQTYVLQLNKTGEG